MAGVGKVGEGFFGELGELGVVFSSDPEDWAGDFTEMKTEVFLRSERPMVEAFCDGGSVLKFGLLESCRRS